MKTKLAIVVVVAWLAGLFTNQFIPQVRAQQQPSRFVLVGNDGPFRVWKDTKSNHCFIVTTPYFALMPLETC